MLGTGQVIPYPRLRSEKKLGEGMVECNREWYRKLMEQKSGERMIAMKGRARSCGLGE